MRTELKKRISLGSVVILNISKGRFLVPGGIKGLRVGFNSRNTHTAAGSYGSIVRQSISDSSSSNKIEENKNGEPQTASFTEEVSVDQITGKNIITTLYLISMPAVLFIIFFTNLNS
ncbi:MAG TPA: hypothetical protein PKV85_05155, partial [Spirochaetota bacterium]|nr:hypothetical protein [Spirochaetota bacterium]